MLLPDNARRLVIPVIWPELTLEPAPVCKHELAIPATCAALRPRSSVRHRMRAFPAHSRQTFEQASFPRPRGHVEKISITPVQHPLAVKKICLPIPDIAASICVSLFALAGPYPALESAHKLVQRVGPCKDAVIAMEASLVKKSDIRLTVRQSKFAETLLNAKQDAARILSSRRVHQRASPENLLAILFGFAVR